MPNERIIRILSAEDIKKTLTMPQAIAAMRTAFTELSESNVEMPTRAHVDVAKHRGTALFMPSYAERYSSICIKTVTLFPDNPANGLPLIQGMVCLFDATNGSPLAKPKNRRDSTRRSAYTLQDSSQRPNDVCRSTPFIRAPITRWTERIKVVPGKSA